jgi:hypothetical protein
MHHIREVTEILTHLKFIRESTIFAQDSINYIEDRVVDVLWYAVSLNRIAVITE